VAAYPEANVPPTPARTSTGTYSSSSVASGSYDVAFVDDDGIDGAQYYDKATAIADATPVTITQFTTRSGRVAAPAALPTGTCRSIAPAAVTSPGRSPRVW
jgi:hypothetical protein